MKIIFALFSFLVFFLTWVSFDLTVMENLSLALFIFCFLEFLYDLGKRIVILDFMLQAAIFTCLIMPIIFYHVYNKENHMAWLWVKYMPITSDSYFSFALPAVIMMGLGLRVPIKQVKVQKNPSIYMERVQGV